MRQRTDRRASRDSGGMAEDSEVTGEPTVLPVPKKRPTWEETRRSPVKSGTDRSSETQTAAATKEEEEP